MSMFGTADKEKSDRYKSTRKYKKSQVAKIDRDKIRATTRKRVKRGKRMARVFEIKKELKKVKWISKQIEVARNPPPPPTPKNETLPEPPPKNETIPIPPPEPVVELPPPPPPVPEPEPVVEISMPVIEPKEESSGVMLYGIVAGAAVIILCLILMVFCKKKKENSPEKLPQEDLETAKKTRKFTVISAEVEAKSTTPTPAPTPMPELPKKTPIVPHPISIASSLQQVIKPSSSSDVSAMIAEEETR